MNAPHLNQLAREIGELEKNLTTLMRLPQLMRASYWIARIEQLQGEAGLSARDRQRLVKLLEQIDARAGTALPLAA